VRLKFTELTNLQIHLNTCIKSYKMGIFMVGVYSGKILRVDLSHDKIHEEKWDLSLARKIIGSIGIAAKIMLEEVDPEIKAFDPENRLILVPGVLSGTTIPGGNKSAFIAKSPLTNAWGDSLFSAMCGINLKRAGYDGVIIQGRAEKPSYLHIFDNGAELRDASKLWGMDTFETCNMIKRELGKNIGIACIGPAGEKLVRLASIFSDDGRAAGRTGLGAVMGSKNLKAIAIEGNQKIEVVNENRFNEIKREMLKRISEKKPLQFGTAGSLEPFNEMGNLPTKNWRLGRFPDADKIGGKAIHEKLSPKKKTCFACPVACSRIVEIKKDEYSFKTYGPEYETLASLGSFCMNSNLESIVKANDICNRLGIDTISAGVAIAFAMECYEKGIITKNDTGGIELTWGNHEAIIKLCELIGKKEGFGSLLGEGVRIAAEKIGRGSEKFAMHVKGLEIPMHNPYRFKEMGLNYATSNRGACHNRGSPAYISRGVLLPEFGYKEKTDGFIEHGKGKMTKIHQDVCTMIDALGLCKFVVFFGGVGISILADAYSAATGWETSIYDLVKAGERIWLIERAFNVKMGIKRNDDKLPERFINEPLPDGPAAGQTVKLDPMLNEYYNERGLDNEGRPKEDTLISLGLEWVIPFIKSKK
jgi:aldehyde:ferredoxin oxidoreductase